MMEVCLHMMVHGQFATRAQMQTLSRKPAIVVPSVIPSFSKRLSRARRFPTWFIVAPQRNRLLMCSRIWLVLDTPLSSRYWAISFRRRPVLPIMPHLWFGELGFARLLGFQPWEVSSPTFHLKTQYVYQFVCSCFWLLHSKLSPRIAVFRSCTEVSSPSISRKNVDRCMKVKVFRKGYWKDFFTFTFGWRWTKSIPVQNKYGWQVGGLSLV